MLITNFSAGELSKYLNGRVDLQQYYSGVSHLENFEVIPTGGIKRRTGTKRLMELNGDSRVIPFIIDGNTIYIVIVYPGSFQIYQLVNNYSGTKNTVTLSFVKTINNSYQNVSEIKQIQYAQTYDTLVMVHRNYAPLWLKWDSSGINAAEMTPDFYPNVVLSDPDNQVMLVDSEATAPIKSTTAAGNMQFTYTDISGQTLNKVYPIGAAGYYLQKGTLYKYPWQGSSWEPTSPAEEANGLFTTEGNYPGAVSFYNNRLIYASTVNKQQKLWASMAPSTNDTRYNKFATFKKYVTFSKVLKEADLHTFTADLAVADIDTANNRSTLRNVSQSLASITDIGNYFIHHDLFPIGTKVVSVDDTAHTMIINTANIDIAEDQSNLVCNVSLWKDPTTATADDYEYQLAEQDVTTADCSFNFELASDQNDAIKFVSAGRYLSIATESTIWAMTPDATALNIQVQMQGRYGSDDIQGVAIAQATVYFAQGKKAIREFYFDNAASAFQTNNIAIHAQQMLEESPAIDFDYCTNPYNKLLITRSDGVVASLLYDKNNGVMAWNRITRKTGVFKSTAVTRGFSDKDLAFFIVKYGNNENTSYYLEMLYDETEIYLDSWSLYSSDVLADYEDNAILWNETKNITCLKTNIPADFMEDGDIVYIGYKFTSYIKSMPVIANDPNSKKRITNLLVRFLESYKPTLKVTGLPDEHFINMTVPYSGVANITYPGITDRDVYFELEAEDEKPVNILAVNALLA